MARHVIQNSVTGDIRIVGDAALPFFPGYAIVDTLEDGQPPAVFYGAGESDLRYVNVTELADSDSPAMVALRAALERRGVLNRPRYSPPPTDLFVTGFASGHGWTNTGLALFQADATEYVFGTRGLQIGAKDAGGYTEKSGLSLDLTGRDFRVWFRLTNLSNAQEFSFYAGDATMANHYKWTIIAPGGDAQQIAKSNEWVSLVLNFQDAQVTGSPNRAALTNLRFFIQSTSTTVNFAATLGGVALVRRSPVFPIGVASFTFDDCYGSHFTAARPALDKYGYAGTEFVIIDRIDTAGFMTMAQLRHLHDRSGWEIAAHATTLARHDAGFPALATADLDHELRDLRGWLDDNGFRGSQHLAYPLGAFTTAMIDTVRKYFASARTTSRQTREVPRPAMPLRTRTVNVTNTDSVASLKAMVDQAYAHGGWLQFCFHQLVNTATTATHYLTTDFQQVVDYCATKGIPVRTVGEVLAAGQGGVGVGMDADGTSVLVVGS